MNSLGTSALDNVLNRLELTKDDCAVLSWAVDVTKNGTWATLPEDSVEEAGHSASHRQQRARAQDPARCGCNPGSAGNYRAASDPWTASAFSIRQDTSRVRGSARVLRFPAQQAESKMIH